jgi:hypothetical protein
MRSLPFHCHGHRHAGDLDPERRSRAAESGHTTSIKHTCNVIDYLNTRWATLDSRPQ